MIYIMILFQIQLGYIFFAYTTSSLNNNLAAQILQLKTFNEDLMKMSCFSIITIIFLAYTVFKYFRGYPNKYLK